jgi:kynurenine formamidase
MHLKNFLRDFEFVDLTHTLDSSIPSWDGSCGFSHHNTIDYPDCTTETQFRVQQISIQAGIGTHVDAQAHCIQGGESIADIPISKLIGPCVVFDVSDRGNSDYSLSPKEIFEFEKESGILEPGDFLLLHTGWEQHWNNPKKYRNDLKFPGISADAATLLKDRQIAGLGIDTLGVDRPSSGFPAHRILLGAGVLLIENVSSSLQMPTRGGLIICLPIKGRNLTESPVRLIGLKPKEANTR